MSRYRIKINGLVVYMYVVLLVVANKAAPIGGIEEGF